MELSKTKFKETEIGLIPKDWRILKLKETLAENPKYGIGAAATDFNLNLPTYLRITDIEEDGTLRKNDLKSVNHQDSGNYFLKENDIVFARTGASVGKSYLYDVKDGQLVYAGFLIKVSPDNSILIPQFLKAFVSTKTYWNWVAVMSMRSGQPGINSNEFGSLNIPLPPLPEQKAIAQVLTDIDSLLQTLEQKLAKKRAIKQGAMQQLLMPKEGWEVKKLKDYVIISSGESPSKFTFDSSGIPFFKVDQLNNSTKYQSDTPFYISTNKSIPKGSIIFPKRGASILLNKVRILKEDSFMDTNLMTLTLVPELNNEFAYYLIIKIQLWRIADTTSIPQINNKHINSIEIPIPPLTEQIRIATILSDMDTELAQLEQKLEKYKLLKHGLMQELLTGRIRLV